MTKLNNINSTKSNFTPKMSVLFILISASLVIALGFLGAFVWSVKSGQYDDDYTPSVRMLFDDELTTNNKTETTKTTND